MLVSYMQNASLKMTKEMYFEMCEALGNDPVESEIPVDYNDFPIEIQEIINIYKFLKDEWEPMNGIYMGKNFVGVLEIFNIFEVDNQDRQIYLSLLHTIDSIRSEEIKKQQAVTKQNN